MPPRSGHCAVSLDHLVIIIGDMCRYAETSSTRVIWIYDLYTEEWKRHAIPDTSCAPEPFHGAVAAAIDKTVYIFGGRSSKHDNVLNATWKLSKTNRQCFAWSCNKPQCKEKTPSPRTGHTGWEYAGKLWIFGGCGYSPMGYLNNNGDIDGYYDFAKNNQLLCFDPQIDFWTNPQCFGSVPTPRSDHATAIINDKVWLFGGRNTYYKVLGDMFELSMNSLTWCLIPTAQIHLARSHCTLTAVAEDTLVIHGGFGIDHKMNNITLSDTWIIDLTSHSRRLYKSRRDQDRMHHTGSVGLKNNSIIIGGSKDYTGRGCDGIVFKVMLGPKSLQQVAMQVILKHQDELPLNCLPRKLLSLLGISVKEEHPNVPASSEHLVMGWFTWITKVFLTG